MDTPLLTEIKNSINPNNEDNSLNTLIDKCYEYLQTNINEYPSNEHTIYLIKSQKILPKLNYL